MVLSALLCTHQSTCPDLHNLRVTTSIVCWVLSTLQGKILFSTNIGKHWQLLALGVMCQTSPTHQKLTICHALWHCVHKVPFGMWGGLTRFKCTCKVKTSVSVSDNLNRWRSTRLFQRTPSFSCSSHAISWTYQVGKSVPKLNQNRTTQPLHLSHCLSVRAIKVKA